MDAHVTEFRGVRAQGSSCDAYEGITSFLERNGADARAACDDEDSGHCFRIVWENREAGDPAAAGDGDIRPAVTRGSARVR